MTGNQWCRMCPTLSANCFNENNYIIEMFYLIFNSQFKKARRHGFNYSTLAQAWEINNKITFIC